MNDGPPNSVLLKIYNRFIRLRGEPRKIALGFALGILVGMTPTLGAQTAIVVFLAALLKWNKISAALGVWITNPLTAPFVYGATYLTGAKLLGMQRIFDPAAALADRSMSILEVIRASPRVFWAMLAGGVVLGLPLAAGGYYLSYRTVVKYREDLRQRLAMKRRKLADRRRERRARRMDKKIARPSSRRVRRRKHRT